MVSNIQLKNKQLELNNKLLNQDISNINTLKGDNLIQNNYSLKTSLNTILGKSDLFNKCIDLNDYNKNKENNDSFT